LENCPSGRSWLLKTTGGTVDKRRGPRATALGLCRHDRATGARRRWQGVTHSNHPHGPRPAKGTVHHRLQRVSRPVQHTGAPGTLGVAATHGTGGVTPHSRAAVWWGAHKWNGSLLSGPATTSRQLRGSPSNGSNQRRDGATSRQRHPMLALGEQLRPRTAPAPTAAATGGWRHRG